MSNDIHPSDWWIRLRWCPSRLPRDYPALRHPMRLLAGAIKHLGRYCGWEVREMFSASAGPPPGSAEGTKAVSSHVDGWDAPANECATGKDGLK